MPSIYFWRDTTGQGLERLQIADGLPIVARSTVINTDGGFTYRATISTEWQFQMLTVTTTDTGRTLDLKRLADGRWLKDGDETPELQDALEIDLQASPFTNTLPIRRLKLEIGQSAEIVTAYVSFPDLTVSPDPQRYTRKDAYHYLYESLDSDFSRTIQVDENGFIADYPGLFTKV